MLGVGRTRLHVVITVSMDLLTSAANRFV